MDTADLQPQIRADWQPLSQLVVPGLWRGTVLRITAAQWPYEPVVDLMCLESRVSDCGLSLIVCTGQKAGLTLIELPLEAKFQPDASSLSVEWLRANWGRWIYPECSVEQVLVIPQYPSNMCINHREAAASLDLQVE
ncbi:hypothetical protein DBR23_04915 [Acidovorax sp. HMWF018]|uniref:Imm45 family immunity protein n=1 Tax=Acidovorax TaxID=12916 RepID=UPI000D37601E|nr:MULTISPECIES: Imm45 family immunity protein [unclassified Acidovorax]MCT6719503.1 Imm45 family immunity protein [Acidovorax sp. K2F]PTT41819.1 hypothetical protein DBR23_04915 [Acidovorax sp. HMWF018]